MYIVIILVLIFIIFQTYININFIFHRKKNDDNIQIIIKMLFGIIRFKFKIPYIDVVINRKKTGIKVEGELGKGINDEKKLFGLKKIQEQYRKIKEVGKLYNSVSKFLLSSTVCDNFKLQIDTGIGDAAYSAYLVTFLYTVIYGSISIASSYINLSKISITIKPDYDRFNFEADLNCIFRIKIVNIIIAGMRAFFIFLQQKIFHKGGVHNERPSY